jgi:hypothetical protein
MNAKTPHNSVDWEHNALRAISAAGIETSPTIAARAGRTLARLAPAFPADTNAPSKPRATAAREGAAARVAFIAALGAHARD